MAKRLGDSMQMPPMVSAVKVAGVPLYKHARKGKTVERKSRLIHLYQFKMLRFESPDAEFEMRCTKGTYVRTLCHDIGEDLGCYAHLIRLRRTRSGSLGIDQALPLDEVLKMSKPELLEHILPLRQFA
jgi:tRNA pseudouridine55 synthase